MARNFTVSMHPDTIKKTTQLSERLKISRSELTARILETIIPKLIRSDVNNIEGLTGELLKIWTSGEAKPRSQ